jgi:hypothetical protein
MASVKDDTWKRIADGFEKLGIASLAIGMYAGLPVESLSGMAFFGISIGLSQWRAK